MWVMTRSFYLRPARAGAPKIGGERQRLKRRPGARRTARRRGQNPARRSLRGLERSTAPRTHVLGHRSAACSASAASAARRGRVVMHERGREVARAARRSRAARPHGRREPACSVRDTRASRRCCRRSSCASDSKRQASPRLTRPDISASLQYSRLDRPMREIELAARAARRQTESPDPSGSAARRRRRPRSRDAIDAPAASAAAGMHLQRRLRRQHARARRGPTRTDCRSAVAGEDAGPGADEDHVGGVVDRRRRGRPGTAARRRRARGRCGRARRSKTSSSRAARPIAAARAIGNRVIG